MLWMVATSLRLGIMYCSNCRLVSNRLTDLLIQTQYCRVNAVVQSLYSDDISYDGDGSCEPLSNPHT